LFFTLAGAVVDVCAEFVGDGLRITVMAGVGDLLGLDFGTDLAISKNLLKWLRWNSRS
jgi:hypothetical protein